MALTIDDQIVTLVRSRLGYLSAGEGERERGREGGREREGAAFQGKLAYLIVMLIYLSSQLITTRMNALFVSKHKCKFQRLCAKHSGMVTIQQPKLIHENRQCRKERRERIEIGVSYSDESLYHVASQRRLVSHQLVHCNTEVVGRIPSCK